MLWDGHRSVQLCRGPLLRARVVKRFGAFTLDVDTTCAERSTLVVAGESGAGKTTLLRMLAGLDNPDTGRIEIGEKVLFDAESGWTVPPWEREIGYLSQQYALFPHMSVFENVAFGLRAQRITAGVGLRVQRALDQVGMNEAMDRRPGQLSGGQQQRVALARALVLEPKLLLLDEPLSALDLSTRRAVRGQLRRILLDLPCITVYVTHNPLEATLFGNRILVIEAGRVTQDGTPDDLLRHPRSAYVGEFMGVNVFHGRVVRREGDGLAEVQTRDGSLAVVDPGVDDDVFIAVSPTHITLFLEEPAGSARNTFAGVVQEIVPEPPFGERVRIVLATTPPLVAEVTREAVAQLGLREGLKVYASFKATAVRSYQ